MSPQLPRKALIPLAGLGTRMFPASKAVKKELFPIITPDGRCICLLQRLLEEAVSAGIEQIGLIVRPGDEAAFSALFEPVAADIWARLSDSAKAEEAGLQSLAGKISFLRQDTQEGFGHAIHCAREWVGEEPFLLMLSDHIYLTSGDKSCSRQLLDAFHRHGGKSIISLYPVQGEKVAHYGTGTGNWLDGDTQTLELTSFVEKPSLDYARQHLQMKNMQTDSFLCVYGQYVLAAEIFAILGQQIAANQRQRGEFQLTSALAELCKKRALLGFRVEGKHYDTGQPMAYAHSLAAFAGLQIGSTP
jgi:UTP--glucose-1-phosphate uridylyltransferase